MPDGKRDIGYIAGKVDAIHEDVRELKKTSVTKEDCKTRHKGISSDFHRIESWMLEGTNPRMTIPSAADSSPSIPLPSDSLDIWAWFSKRLPVILGILALLGGLGAVYKMLLMNRATTNEARGLINGKSKVQLVQVPVHHYHVVTPDGGIKDVPDPRKKKRKRNK